MISALLAASAVLVLLPGGARRRWRVVVGRRSPRAVPLDLVAAGLLPLVAHLLVGWVGLVVALVAAPVVRARVRDLASARQRSRDAILVRQAPPALDLLAAVLAAGRPAETAVATVAERTPAPLGDVLRDVARRLRLSCDPVGAWRTLDGTALEAVGRAFARSESSGAAIVPLVTDAAEDIRRRSRGLRREAVGGVAVRTTIPLGLCMLPAFVLVAIAPTVLAVVLTIPR